MSERTIVLRTYADVVGLGVFDNLVAEVAAAQKQVIDTLHYRWAHTRERESWTHEITLTTEDVGLTHVRVHGELRGM